MPNGRIGRMLRGGRQDQDPFGREALPLGSSALFRDQDPFGRASLPLGAVGPFQGRIARPPVTASSVAPSRAVASMGAGAPSVAPSLATSPAAAPQAQPMTRVPQEPRMPQRRGRQWQNVLGLALATMADAMAARAGRQGQAVSGLREQIAGREGREAERAQREVLRQYRNKMQQFQFEQENVRRRLAKEEKLEEREYRRGEKQDEREWLLKQLQGGGVAAQAPPEGTIGRRLWKEKQTKSRKEFQEQLRTTPLGDLTTPGSQGLIDIFNNASIIGMSSEEAESKLREAIRKKRMDIESRRQALQEKLADPFYPWPGMP